MVRAATVCLRPIASFPTAVFGTRPAVCPLSVASCISEDAACFCKWLRMNHVRWWKFLARNFLLLKDETAAR